MIDVGDIAPRFTLSGGGGTTVDLDDATIAGRFIVLLFAPPGRSADLAAHVSLAGLLRERHNALVYAVVSGPTVGRGAQPEPSNRPQLTFPVLLDADQTVSDAYGIDQTKPGLAAVVLGPNHHVRAVCTDPETLHTDVAAAIEASQEQWVARISEAHPPVLVVPDILSADDCKRLISIYRMQGNVFVDPGHGDTGMTDDYKMRIPEYGRGDRIDHWILNAETNRLIDDRFQKRLFPEVFKAFQYRITRREHYRIGCYEGERGGDLNGHRDNTEPGVAHRRFAVSVNLNTEAFAGGAIQFLEYGAQRYRPESGAAIVFSSSLLHEILEVNEGRRYVLLAFLFGDT